MGIVLTVETGKAKDLKGIERSKPAVYEVSAKRVKVIGGQATSDYIENLMEFAKENGKRIVFSYVDMSGQDLSGLDLSLATFFRVILKGTDFNNADLHETELKFVDISGVKNFENARRIGAAEYYQVTMTPQQKDAIGRQQEMFILKKA